MAMETKKNGFAAFSLAFAMVFASFSSGSHVASAAQPAHFSCSAGMVVDYSQPLRTLPPLHKIGSVRRPFLGISGLELRGINSPVIAGAGRVAATLLRSEHSHGKTWPRLALAKLQQIDAAGRPVGSAHLRRLSLRGLEQGKVPFLSLGFHVGAHPALYRFDVEFRSGRKKTRAHFAEYVRVVRKVARVRLGLASATVQPGERLAFRVEDIGTLSASFGLEFKIERLEGARWVNGGLAPTAFIQIGYSIPGGFAGACQGFRIPRDLEAGTFRLSKAVKIGENQRTVFHRFTVGVND